MPKTLIELDAELLEAAANALGTRTKRDTVTAALKAAVAVAAQRRELEMLVSGTWADPQVLESARLTAWDQ